MSSAIRNLGSGPGVAAVARRGDASTLPSVADLDFASVMNIAVELIEGAAAAQDGGDGPAGPGLQGSRDQAQAIVALAKEVSASDAEAPTNVPGGRIAAATAPPAMSTVASPGNTADSAGGIPGSDPLARSAATTLLMVATQSEAGLSAPNLRADSATVISPAQQSDSNSEPMVRRLPPAAPFPGTPARPTGGSDTLAIDDALPAVQRIPANHIRNRPDLEADSLSAASVRASGSVNGASLQLGSASTAGSADVIQPQFRHRHDRELDSISAASAPASGVAAGNSLPVSRDEIGGSGISGNDDKARVHPSSTAPANPANGIGLPFAAAPSATGPGDAVPPRSRHRHDQEADSISTVSVLASASADSTATTPNLDGVNAPTPPMVGAPAPVTAGRASGTTPVTNTRSLTRADVGAALTLPTDHSESWPGDMGNLVAAAVAPLSTDGSAMVAATATPDPGVTQAQNPGNSQDASAPFVGMLGVQQNVAAQPAAIGGAIDAASLFSPAPLELRLPNQALQTSGSDEADTITGPVMDAIPASNRGSESRFADRNVTPVDADMPAAPAPSATAYILSSGNDGSGTGATTSFSDAMGLHVLNMIATGHQEATLHIQPPQLGALTIRVSVQGRDVSTWFGTAQPQVQVAVTQALGQLRTDLAGSGLNLAGAWVGADASSMQQRAFDDIASPSRRAGPALRAVAPAAIDNVEPHQTAGVNIYV